MENKATYPGGGFKGPLFIVGVPRSGTKLLRDLLNRHRKVGIPDEESQFLPGFVYSHGEHLAPADVKNTSRVLRELEQSNFCRLMKAKNRFLDYKKVKAACRKGNTAKIIEAVIRSFLPKNKAADPNLIWGDKTPFYSMHLPMLVRLYPMARFIHIIRDPRDVAYSGLHAWGKSFLRSSVDWRKSIRAAWAFRDDPVRVAPFLEIRYEDLLRDAEAVMLFICRFCGISFDPKMLSLEKNTETWADTKGETRIIRHNVRKFEKLGNKKDIRLIEELTFYEMARCGYDVMYATRCRRASKKELFYRTLVDGARVLEVYIREKGVIEGIRYKLKQRHIRRIIR